MKKSKVEEKAGGAGGSSAAAMDEAAFLKAAEKGDLATVQLAVETHKLDPNCKDVSASPTLSPPHTHPLFTSPPPSPSSRIPSPSPLYPFRGCVCVYVPALSTMA